jgi:hypothetical protein
VIAPPIIAILFLSIVNTAFSFMLKEQHKVWREEVVDGRER